MNSFSLRHSLRPLLMNGDSPHLDINFQSVGWFLDLVACLHLNQDIYVVKCFTIDHVTEYTFPKLTVTKLWPESVTGLLTVPQLHHLHPSFQCAVCTDCNCSAWNYALSWKYTPCTDAPAKVVSSCIVCGVPATDALVLADHPDIAPPLSMPALHPS